MKTIRLGITVIILKMNKKMTFLNQKPTEFKDTLQIPHGKK